MSNTPKVTLTSHQTGRSTLVSPKTAAKVPAEVIRRQEAADRKASS